MIRLRHVSMAAQYLRFRYREIHPFEVQALLLNACDLKCVYCRYPEIKTALVPTDAWRQLIRELGALGTMRIKFQGGEPTLRHDFRELCGEAKRAGITTAVVTHGQRIAAQPELLDNLDEVVVSLDGVRPEVHDRLRGTGTHAGAITAIDLALGRGRRAYVVMVVSQENLAEVGPLLTFCESRGVRMHAQPVTFGRDPFDDTARHLALTDQEVRDLHRQLATWKRQGRGLMFSAQTYERVADWPDHSVLTTRSQGASTCMAGQFYVHIEANGDVWPCGHHGANFVAKNAIRDGLVASLRHVRRHNCADCASAFLNERKAVFGLRPAALLEVVRRG